MARQGENGGVHIGMNMLLLEMLVEALHGYFGRIVVLTQMAKHDIFYPRMIDFRQKPRRLGIAQMPDRTGYALFQNVWIVPFF